ncbi:MAG: hypothetical protein RLY58_1449 [Pseudomonadota bacterium]|jgi:glycosyltransferase involved in cell wall biosynthesis
MKIGVITASYNRQALLMRCIDSVRAQSYADWGMYIVDDCSNVDVCELQAHYEDERLHCLKLPQNHGANVVRNRAIDWAIADHCDYIFLLDDDDFLAVDAFSTMVAVQQQYPQYHWFVMNVMGYQHALAEHTLIQMPAMFDYIGDYLLGKTVRGDKSHLIAVCALANIRFSTAVRNGEEWTFFLQLAKYTACFAHPAVVKIVDYQPMGLSQQLAQRQSTFNKILLDTQKPLRCWWRRPFLRRAMTRSIQALLRFPFRLCWLAGQSLVQCLPTKSSRD